MLNLKAGIKVSLLSTLIFVGSVATTAQADHDHQSILPFLAVGVIASVLLNNTRTYRYEKKRYYGYRSHGNNHSSKYRYRKHSYSRSGYQYETKRRYRH